MAQIPFDTLAFAKRLIEAGMEARVAEAQAALQADVFAHLTKEKFATKENITSLANKIDHVETSLLSQIGKTHARIDKLDSRIDKLDSRMDKLDSRMDKLDSRMDKLNNRMDGIDIRMDKIEIHMGELKAMVANGFEGFRKSITIRIGSVLVTALIAVSVGLKFLHF